MPGDGSSTLDTNSTNSLIDNFVIFGLKIVVHEKVIMP